MPGTLSNVFLPRNKCGFNTHPPSTKHAQCQTVLSNSLKSSRNEAINSLWKSTAISTNIQFGQYKSTKEVLKYFHLGKENKLKDKLYSQESFFRNMMELSLPNLNSPWSSAQSNLPTNIFNFSIKYIKTPSQHRPISKYGASDLHLTVLSALYKILFSISFLVAKCIFNRAATLGNTIPSSYLLPKHFSLYNKQAFCRSPWIYQLFCCHWN